MITITFYYLLACFDFCDALSAFTVFGGCCAMRKREKCVLFCIRAFVWNNGQSIEKSRGWTPDKEKEGESEKINYKEEEEEG